jgi:hypothetical protein
MQGHMQSPIELRKSSKPSVSRFRVFGCQAIRSMPRHWHVPRHWQGNQRNKADCPGEECVFIGCAVNSQAWRLRKLQLQHTSRLSPHAPKGTMEGIIRSLGFLSKMERNTKRASAHWTAWSTVLWTIYPQRWTYATSAATFATGTTCAAKKWWCKTSTGDCCLEIPKSNVQTFSRSRYCITRLP